MKSWRKPILVALIAAFSLTSLQGCFGSFELTQSLYQWNKKVSNNKFVEQLLFWALCIIPVYELAGVGDLFVFNLLEFWTGSNPVALHEQPLQPQRLADGSLVMEHQGRRYQIQPLGQERVALLIQGRQVATATMSPQGMLLEDQDHGRSVHMTPQEMDQLLQGLQAQTP